MPSLPNFLRQTKETAVLLANPLARQDITYIVVFYYRRFEQKRQGDVKTFFEIGDSLVVQDSQFHGAVAPTNRLERLFRNWPTKETR